MKISVLYLALLFGLVACTPASAPDARGGADFVLCRAVETAPNPVWQGLGGWLFNRGDMIARFDPGVPVRSDLARLAQAFRLQGVTLVAVVLPTRASVYEGQLDRRKPVFADYSAAAARQSYRDFLAELRAAGILAPDLTLEIDPLPVTTAPAGTAPNTTAPNATAPNATAPIGMAQIGTAPADRTAFYFKYDQHWTSIGARRAAAAVAATLRPLPAYQKLEKTRFRTRSQGWVTQKGWLQERAENLCHITLPDETLEVFTTAPVADSKPGRATAAALFAEPVAPPVTLVGTSNSKRLPDKPDLNFSGFLRESLGLEVFNAAFAGAGVYGSLLPYLHSDEYRAAKPKFIVWETLIWDWHNRLGLPDEHRQVIPSVYGACTPAAGLLPTLTEADDQTDFTVLRNGAALPLQGHDYFIYLEVEDRALVDFSLELRYAGGQAESVRLVHMTRVPNPGRFFLELSDELPNFQSAAIKAQREVTGVVRARICRAPSALP